MAARTARRAVALGCCALWWWAVLRLALAPGAGVVEGAVAVGGWGLSVLPVHCVPRRRAVGALEAGRWRRALWGTWPDDGPNLPGKANRLAEANGVAEANRPGEANGPTEGRSR
ncbi:hypothetical protein [Streptomyces sp. NRRL F-5650]|jgi:hypothetical protein|uniref:hypothetical protein n=1 Tax=Streptomyces sp. NRRL F-5650 TaxID=1463868 RepID=UPI00099C9973|nr:hypothetical protein [Streptomyces sp. NRRL F-5650]